MAEKLRYGVSALDLGLKQFAEADEIMVCHGDGRIFYKRPDGQIVFPIPAMSNEIIGMLMPGVKAVYNLVDISSVAAFTSSSAAVNTALSSYFHVSAGEAGLKFALRGNSIVDTAVEIMRDYLKSSGVESTLPEIEVVFNVKVGEEENLFAVQCDYNSITALDLFGVESEVNLRAISCPKLYFMWNLLPVELRDSLTRLNFDNPCMELGVMDVMYHCDDVSKTTIYGDNGLVTLQGVSMP